MQLTEFGHCESDLIRFISLMLCVATSLAGIRTHSLQVAAGEDRLTSMAKTTHSALTGNKTGDQHDPLKELLEYNETTRPARPVATLIAIE